MTSMKENRLTTEQCRDTALVAVLALLVFAHYGGRPGLVLPAIVVLLLAMLVPAWFRPLAIVWWGLAGVLAVVGSNVVLALIFAVVVTPIGLLRRLWGADPMLRRAWGGQGSVFVARDARFSAEDLEAPF
jgi:hypothetical protein